MALVRYIDSGFQSNVKIGLIFLIFFFIEGYENRRAIFIIDRFITFL